MGKRFIKEGSYEGLNKVTEINYSECMYLSLFRPKALG